MGILDDPTDGSSNKKKTNPKPAGGGQQKDPFGYGADLAQLQKDIQTSDSQPLGVPIDYHAPPPLSTIHGFYPHGYNYTHHQYPGGPLQDQVAAVNPTAWGPRYFEGDQYQPRNADPDTIWATQQSLAALGFLTGSFSKKVWDQPTADAWKHVLEYANQAGITDQQALIELGTRVRENGRFTVNDKGEIVPAGQEAPPPPLIIEQTDPKILKEIFRQAAIQLRGIGWNDSKLAQAASVYNALERKTQEELYNAQVQGHNATVNKIPSSEEFINQYIRNQDPEQVQEHEALGFAADALSFLSSPAWGAK